MSTQVHQVFYNKTEFTSAGVGGANFNSEIFQAEISQATFSGVAPSVYVQGSTVVVQFAYLPTAGDITTLDGLVTAHVGGTLVGNFQRVIDETESAGLDSTTPTQRIELLSGLLPAGNYIVAWYMEGRTTSVVANSGIRMSVEADMGSGYVERGEFSWDLSVYAGFSGSLPQTRLAGQILNLRLMYRRLGGSSNPVFVQRARLSLVRLV